MTGKLVLHSSGFWVNPLRREDITPKGGRDPMYVAWRKAPDFPKRFRAHQENFEPKPKYLVDGDIISDVLSSVGFLLQHTPSVLFLLEMPVWSDQELGTVYGVVERLDCRKNSAGQISVAPPATNHQHFSMGVPDMWDSLNPSR